VAERRQVTIMFCDMVGSSALSTRLDPEEQREVVSSFQGCCASEIKRLGGMVAQYLGDGILAYFGYPTAHEDDAERAVRAGLAILDAVSALEPSPGVVLQARIGIASGVVIVGDLVREGVTQENAAIGETPNLAARLQSLAEPSTLVIAPETHRLIGQLFEYRDLGHHSLKGFAEPVQVRQVLSSSNVESRFDAFHRVDGSLLLGREEEANLILRRWEQVKTGSGRVVLLTGEPGIGKSRITRQVQEEVSSEQNTTLIYHCSPHHLGSPLYPIIGQLLRGAHIERNDNAAVRLEKLEALLAQSSENLAEDLPLFATLLAIPTGERYQLPSLTAQQLKQRTLDALLQHLGRLATAKPVLLVFEDLHWMDPTSLELLSMVVDQATGLPILLLATSRPEFSPPWAGHSHISTIPLSRLSPHDVRLLVENVTRGKTLPPEVLNQIVERTDGVPLFIEELTKTVLESGLLRLVDDHYELTMPLPSFAIPTTLHASLLARLDRLGSAKDLAQIGAAIGREFSHGLIAAVSALGEKDLQAGLSQLIGAELIFQRGAPPDATYQFKHALVQDVAYASLVRSRRQRLHGAIAHALEERFPDIGATEPETLARHYAEAPLMESAVHYWGKAGELASARSAYAEAIAHLRNGIDLIATLPPGRDRSIQELSLQIALGPACMAAKGYVAPETEGAYLRAREILTELGEVARLDEVICGLYLISFHRATFKRCLELGREMLAKIGQKTGTAPLCVGHRMVAFGLGSMGEFEDADEHSEQAIEFFDRHAHVNLGPRYGHDIGVAAFAYAAITSWHRGRFARTEQYEARALALAESSNHTNSQAYARFFAGALPAVVRRDKAVLSAKVQALSTFASKHKLPQWIVYGNALNGAVLIAADKPDEAIQEIRQAIEQCIALDTNAYRPMFLGLLAEAQIKTGLYDEALATLDHAIAFADSSAERWYTAELFRLKGIVLMAGRSADVEADKAFRSAIKLARSQGSLPFAVRAAASFGSFCRDVGRPQAGLDALAPALGALTEGSNLAEVREAAALLDELKAVRGRSPDATVDA
jgi:class 3 adenylate cyclase/tetratricopeptide (TPR) repeat protein